MFDLRRRLRRMIEKNRAEARAIVSGQLPRFLFASGNHAVPDEPPVFVFHDVQPDTFERQLRYLVDNGYRTLDLDEYGAAAGKGRPKRSVLLTFDDATWTFWAYAFPLLLKYDCTAVLYAVPSIVERDPERHPNLRDVRQGDATASALNSRECTAPICSWRELQEMQATGRVDVQSHSLHHARIAVAERLIDIQSPERSFYYRNLNLPLSILDSEDDPERPLRPGAPIFGYDSRMSGRSRYLESESMVRSAMAMVEDGGGEEFFRRPGWRRKLSSLIRREHRKAPGHFESTQETLRAVRRQFADSRRMLEEGLNKPVRHFAYPWSIGSAVADDLAGEAGYQTVAYGPAIPRRHSETRALQRLDEAYLLRLPGRGRLPLASIWAGRLRRRRMR
jgi:peptidoglycan/xylan/chitin deacetylase (PgdA/CDA1 family)